MILLKSDDACEHCPLNLCCLSGQVLQGVTHCISCGAVLFEIHGTKYACLRLREGVYSRLEKEPLIHAPHKYVTAAVRSTHFSAYKGCIACPSCKQTAPHTTL